MRSICFALVSSGIILFAFITSLLAQENSDDKKPVLAEEVVVSATKTPEDSIDIPSSTSVITGEERKKSGAKTVAEAIQDVAGIDTGNGSDEGGWLANIGMWGLKEFDALLITVNGVPAGGPFNPNLAEINIDDVDRIEIPYLWRGCQLYPESNFECAVHEHIWVRP
jgi:outer membrane receptor protein involved in Fe transport